MLNFVISLFKEFFTQARVARFGKFGKRIFSDE